MYSSNKNFKSIKEKNLSFVGSETGLGSETGTTGNKKGNNGAIGNINNMDLDVYSICGINHFQEKFGLRLLREESKCDGNKVSGNLLFSILRGNESSEKIFIDVAQTNVNSNNFLEFLMDSSISKSIDIYEDRVEVDFDIFKMTGLIFSGKYDDLLLEEQAVDFLSECPIVDCWEKGLFDSLLDINRGLGREQSQVFVKPFWPNNAKFAVCLTHDVDEIRKTYQYITQSFKGLKNLDFRKAAYQSSSFLTDKLTGNNPYWTFEKIMDIEERRGVRSTFFFLKERAKVSVFDKSTWHHYARKYDFRDPEIVSLMRKMMYEGWEVGLHGSFESYLNEEMLKSEKEELEGVLGNKNGVVSIRQHHLNLKIPETWEYQENAGLKYDTSLGFKGGKGIGFRWGTCFPFHPIRNSNGTAFALSLLEIPLTIMDISINPDTESWRKCQRIIDRVEEQGGVLTLLWHHTVFNDKEYPGWGDMYERLISECQRRGAWITSTRKIAEWWLRRKSGFSINSDFEVGSNSDLNIESEMLRCRNRV